jgi:hypothetical protein
MRLQYRIPVFSPENLPFFFERELLLGTASRRVEGFAAARSSCSAATASQVSNQT